MKIKDIKFIASNETRNDGRYPLRVGSTVEFYMKPEVGIPMLLTYISDNQGNPKDGYFRTSVVSEVHETDREVVVTTMNSIYYLSK